MRHFCVTDRHPKPPWRRKKRYTAGELRWLAKRNGWLFRHHKKRIEITEPDGKVVAEFAELEEVIPVPSAGHLSERAVAFTALRASRFGVF